MNSSGVNRRRGQPPTHNQRKSAGRLIALGGIITLCGFLLVLHASFSLQVPSTSKAAVVPNSNPSSLAKSAVSYVECRLAGRAEGDTTTTTDNDRNDKIIRITVRHDLSPIASKVFIDLVQARHFDNVFIFRVLKGFIAQWGVRTADAEKDVLTYEKPDKTKDTVHEHSLSNIRGTLSFAGGNPATRQVFVNLGNNQRLDKENHGTDRPFATVSDQSMNYVFDELYTGYKDGQGQIKVLQQGVEKVYEEFPHWSRIETCRVVSRFSTFETI